MLLLEELAMLVFLIGTQLLSSSEELRSLLSLRMTVVLFGGALTGPYLEHHSLAALQIPQPAGTDPLSHWCRLSSFYC